MTIQRHSIAERIAASSLLKLHEVTQITSMCKGTIYQRMKVGAFPRPVPISKRRVAWKQADILSWLESRQ